MKTFAIILPFALLVGCGGADSPSQAPAATSEAPTAQTRLSAEGESCAKTADCAEGLRCKSQICVDPKAAQQAEAEYMAMVEAMCDCSKAKDGLACMQPLMSKMKHLTETYKGLAENKGLQARAEARMVECMVKKQANSPSLGTMKPLEPVANDPATDPKETDKASEAAIAPTEEAKGDTKEAPAAEEKAETKTEEAIAEGSPKKVSAKEAQATPKTKGSSAEKYILESNAGGALAVALAGEGDEFEAGHGRGGLGVKGNKRGLGMKKSSRARLKLRSGSVRGFCSKSDIASKVRRRAGAIRACYERQLMRNPKLAGKVTARWTIGLDGRVKGRVSANGLGAVGGCIASKIRAIRFKQPEGGICVVQWPFVFSNR